MKMVLDLVKREIDAGRPLLLNISSGYYGNHTVTIVGYHEYTKGEGKNKKRFLKVYDGWSKQPRYIDYEQLVAIRSASTVEFYE